MEYDFDFDKFEHIIIERNRPHWTEKTIVAAKMLVRQALFVDGECGAIGEFCMGDNIFLATLTKDGRMIAVGYEGVANKDAILVKNTKEAELLLQ